MRNIRIEMAYDGTNYHGFQTQKNGITIQKTVENALGEFLGEKIVIYGCGVRNQKDKGNHGSRNTKRIAVVSFSEEIRHGL